MSKERVNQQDHLHESLSDNSKEVLEISPTGYGLESEEEEITEQQNSSEMKNNPPS